MKVKRVLVILMLIMLASGVQAEVEFADPNLEAAVRKAINRDFGDLTETHVKNISSLDLIGEDIKTLAGIEHLVSLDRLGLYGTQVADLSPLAALKNLRHLEILYNRSPKLMGVEAIGELASLTTLALSGLNLSDISFLSGLKIFIGWS